MNHKVTPPTPVEDKRDEWVYRNRHRWYALEHDVLDCMDAAVSSRTPERRASHCIALQRTMNRVAGLMKTVSKQSQMSDAEVMDTEQ